MESRGLRTGVRDGAIDGEDSGVASDVAEPAVWPAGEDFAAIAAEELQRSCRAPVRSGLPIRHLRSRSLFSPWRGRVRRARVGEEVLRRV